MLCSTLCITDKNSQGSTQRIKPTEKLGKGLLRKKKNLNYGLNNEWSLLRWGMTFLEMYRSLEVEKGLG